MLDQDIAERLIKGLRNVLYLRLLTESFMVGDMQYRVIGKINSGMTQEEACRALRINPRTLIYYMRKARATTGTQTGGLLELYRAGRIISVSQRTRILAELEREFKAAQPTH